ncbi:MAG: hypothetical protein GY898_13750 [Proteobacteria bacterium]|nr:hypothetical protein [Pseudomonadota bacterium]
MDEPVIGRLLVVLVIVVAALLGTRSWLGGRHADGVTADVRGQGPNTFRYEPMPGRWLQEIRVEGGEHVLVPVDISRNEDGSSHLSMPWRPPEPDVFGLPPWIQEHAGNIRVRIDVENTGHVIDVVGPDDYFESLGEDDAATADALRALHIEEQIDAVMRWQLTSVMGQPSIVEATWTAEGSFPGLATLPSWTGEFTYRVDSDQPCPPAAVEEESCAGVSVTAEGLSAALIVGRTTGMEWEAMLDRLHDGQRRTVTRRLLRPEDAPAPAAP